MTEQAHTLPLHRGGEVVAHAVLDGIDYVWASQYRWHLNQGYACRSQRRGGRPTRMPLHREILGLKHGYPDLVADHIDGNKLDCRRSNLRAVSRAVNAQNRPGQANSSSRFKGVGWYSAKQCWRVAIMVNGRRTLVGYFDDEEEAGRAAAAFYAENSPYNRQEATAPSVPGADCDSQRRYSDDTSPGPGLVAAPDNPHTER